MTDSTTAIIRVLLVDDDPLVRRELSRLLAGYPRLRVIGEATNGEEAVQLVGTLHPSVVVMDINMPRLDGFAATARIKSVYPHVVIVGLSIDVSEPRRQAMAAAGGESLVSKSKAVEQLYTEIQASINARSSAIH